MGELGKDAPSLEWTQRGKWSPQPGKQSVGWTSSLCLSLAGRPQQGAACAARERGICGDTVLHIHPFEESGPTALPCGPPSQVLSCSLIGDSPHLREKRRVPPHPANRDQDIEILLICKMSRRLISSVICLCLQLLLFYIFKCAAGKNAWKLPLAP